MILEDLRKEIFCLEKKRSRLEKKFDFIGLGELTNDKHFAYRAS